MVPAVAILGGFVAAIDLHSRWMGILVAIVGWVALSHVVHIKAYRVQNEYDRATSTGRYAGEEPSAAAREHLFGPIAHVDERPTET